ncbi:MAG: hypothetical protein BEN19_06470 [Epulopiscium sp. Nuni2H_MBin003]|nr:MAG: hypothetical protein BEN19_06470 [Epulopiscium sp. Nuni2H_MBin003]
MILIILIALILLNLPILAEENLQITSVQIRSELQFIEEVTIYTGQVHRAEHKATPNAGSNYLLVQLVLPEAQSEQVLENFKVEIDNQVYSRVLQDDFLLDFSMQPLTPITTAGTLVFEISDDITDVSTGALTNDFLDTSYSLVQSEYTNVMYKDSIIDQQFQQEMNILSRYFNVEHTFENPFFVVNPYGTAPLSALIMFETPIPATVDVVIKGKDDATDIEYTISERNTHHEVPISGMYADFANNIQLTLNYETGEQDSRWFTITTDALPDYITERNIKNTVTSDQAQDGVVFVVTDNRIVLDKNADVRWFTTMPTGNSDINQILDSNRFLFAVEGYSNLADIYEMDLLGKVHFMYGERTSAHHDAYEMPNGNILFWAGDTLKEIDKSGNTIKELDITDILEQQSNKEYRNTDEDWFHQNSIVYDDGDIIVSARNQHAIIKQDYETQELKWILSPNIYYEDKYLTPVGADFEWFYSQHDATILPDLDNNPDTLDLLLLDNGVHRALVGETPISAEEAYSRMVHYRINEKDMTVEQIFEFGKSYGNELFATVHSGAQYLTESGNYLGTFDSTSQAFSTPDWAYHFTDHNTSKIVEVTPQGEVLAQIEFDTPIYRAYKLPETIFSSGYTKLGESKGKLFVNQAPAPTLDLNGLEVIGDDIIYNINSISYNKDYISISGWAYVEELLDKSPNIYLELLSAENSYIYYLERAKEIKVPDLDEIGFREKYLDTSLVLPDKYSLKLIIQAGQDVYKIPLDYFITIDYKTSDIMEQQSIIEANIINQLKIQQPTIENPYVIVDPYKVNPLSALVIFNAENPAQITVEVAGDYPITHTFMNNQEMQQLLPIYGLYPDKENSVNISITYEDGLVVEKTLTIETGELTGVVPNVEIRTADLEQMAAGVTFLKPDGWLGNSLLAIDPNGDIRYYNVAAESGNVFTHLENNNIIISDDERYKYPYYWSKVYEMNFLGKVYKEYSTPTIHHEICELPNSNLIYAANNSERDTVEDYVIEIDRETGGIVNTWDLMEILNMSDYISKDDFLIGHFGGDEVRARNDWLHINAVWYDEPNNAIVISTRHQDLAMSFDYTTKQINWILTDPVTTKLADDMQQYILDPIGNDFEYSHGIHATLINNAGNLMLFDNGNNRITDSTQNYSRAVEYEINQKDMTVEQVNQYGKERGSEIFSMYMSDVDELATDHWLMSFSGIIRDENGNASSDMMIALDSGQTAAHIIETVNNIPVFEAVLDVNAYRAERITLYPVTNMLDDQTIEVTEDGDEEGSIVLKAVLVAGVVAAVIYFFVRKNNSPTSPPTV